MLATCRFPRLLLCMVQECYSQVRTSEQRLRWIAHITAYSKSTNKYHPLKRLALYDYPPHTQSFSSALDDSRWPDQIAVGVSVQWRNNRADKVDIVLGPRVQGAPSSKKHFPGCSSWRLILNDLMKPGNFLSSSQQSMSLSSFMLVKHSSV